MEICFHLNAILISKLTLAHLQTYMHILGDIPYYSRKYWQELNLAVGPQIAIAKILADLNLAVW